jgi:hypothetical protein
MPPQLHRGIPGKAASGRRRRPRRHESSESWCAQPVSSCPERRGRVLTPAWRRVPNTGGHTRVQSSAALHFACARHRAAADHARSWRLCAQQIVTQLPLCNQPCQSERQSHDMHMRWQIFCRQTLPWNGRAFQTCLAPLPPAASSRSVTPCAATTRSQRCSSNLTKENLSLCR